MNLRLFPTLNNYNLCNLPGDIFSGIKIRKTCANRENGKRGNDFPLFDHYLI